MSHASHFLYLQAVIPVTLPGQPPLSIALLGMPRSDLQLLHLVAKLGPLLGRLAPQIAEQLAAKKQQQQVSRVYVSITRRWLSAAW